MDTQNTTDGPERLSESIVVLVDRSLLAELDKYCVDNERNRSQAVRYAIKRMLRNEGNPDHEHARDSFS